MRNIKKKLSINSIYHYNKGSVDFPLVITKDKQSSLFLQGDAVRVRGGVAPRSCER